MRGFLTSRAVTSGGCGREKRLPGGVDGPVDSKDKGYKANLFSDRCRTGCARGHNQPSDSEARRGKARAVAHRRPDTARLPAHGGFRATTLRSPQPRALRRMAWERVCQDWTASWTLR